jgi:imidazoleglycerol-phosphate dehydratase
LDAKRRASIDRETKETTVHVEVALEGTGDYNVSTTIPMLDHMLEQLARHGQLDISIEASGDTDRDAHHLVEDVAITLGRALDEALGERRGIERFGHAIVPLDEALALVAVDLSGRGYAAINVEFERTEIGGLPMENVTHFLTSLANEARMTLHVQVLAGANDHHKLEAIFKGLARALRQAIAIDPRRLGEVPSTKETL